MFRRAKEKVFFWDRYCIACDNEDRGDLQRDWDCAIGLCLVGSNVCGGSWVYRGDALSHILSLSLPFF